MSRGMKLLNCEVSTSGKKVVVRLALRNPNTGKTSNKSYGTDTFRAAIRLLTSSERAEQEKGLEALGMQADPYDKTDYSVECNDKVVRSVGNPFTAGCAFDLIRLLKSTAHRERLIRALKGGPRCIIPNPFL